VSDHGTHSRYVGGCRCTECREATRTYMASLKTKRREWVQVNGLPSSVAHGASAYNNWGCRCDLCRKAWANLMKARRTAA
jgi:hypothetical protein